MNKKEIKKILNDFIKKSNHNTFTLTNFITKKKIKNLLSFCSKNYMYLFTLKKDIHINYKDVINIISTYNTLYITTNNYIIELKIKE